MSDVRGNCKWHHSYFRKYFQMLLAVNTGQVKYPHHLLYAHSNKDAKNPFFTKTKKLIPKDDLVAPPDKGKIQFYRDPGLGLP